MGDVGAVLLGRIAQDLDHLEASIQGTSRFNFSAFDDYERTIAKQHSKLAAWRANVDLQPERNAILAYYRPYESYIVNKLASVQALLSNRARLRDWTQHPSRFGTFARVLGVLYRGYNLIAPLFGWPPVGTGLLTGGSPRGLEYAPRR